MTTRCIYMGTLQIGNDAQKTICLAEKIYKRGTVCGDLCRYRKVSMADQNKKEAIASLMDLASEVLAGRM